MIGGTQPNRTFRQSISTLYALAVTDGVGLLTEIDIGVSAFAAFIIRVLAQEIIQFAKVTNTLVCFMSQKN
jgi:hypothetical protein